MVVKVGVKPASWQEVKKDITFFSFPNYRP